jgi:DNA (cytosine-5)-methyltransferase 1
MRINFVDVFAGIGGGSLGLERAGLACVGQVEIDPYCNKILEKHWPNVKRIRDIHDVKGDEFGPIQLIFGGYPCQCDSTAGKRKGIEDDRWLWPEMLRIIKYARPDWVVGENVINHENMGLKVVITDLESIGYQVRPFIIPDAACGIQTVERHIWTVAASSKIRLQGSQEDSDSDHRIKREFSRNDKRIFDRWSLPESRLCRSLKRISGGMDRLKCLGNSVSPQIPYILGVIISNINNKFYGTM